VLGSLRSAVSSGDAGALDEFWRELVESSTVTAEFKKKGVSLTELRERVAAVDKLKSVGIDAVAALHDPKVLGNLGKAIASTANAPAPSPTMTDTVAPGHDGEGPFGHKWPPIITLSEANGHYFERGSAELSAAFRQELIDSTPERIAELIKQYGVDVIEVVGHTDEQPLNPKPSNLDHDLLPVLRSEGDIASLIPADNAGLGLARAVSVVSVLLKSKTLAGYKLIPLSGAQLVNTDGTLAISGTPGDIRERRRIEIRLRQSEHHESSLPAPSAPLPLPKSPPARPKVVASPAPRPATPAALPRSVAPPVSPGQDARNRPWWQI
jgi:OmpA family